MLKRILIADDTELYRVALAEILTEGGYEVVGSAKDGAEAVTLATELAPDIVILDVVMPVMNGLEAAREITAMDSPARIVMCTSLGYDPIVEEAVSSGASGYIMKPLTPESVLETLEAVASGATALPTDG